MSLLNTGTFILSALSLKPGDAVLYKRRAETRGKLGKIELYIYIYILYCILDLVVNIYFYPLLLCLSHFSEPLSTYILHLRIKTEIASLP